MNENDDVMGFDDEPNINPEDSYIEPDLSETQKQTSAENPEVTEVLQQDVAAEPSTNDYAGYEGFEAMEDWQYAVAFNRAIDTQMVETYRYKCKDKLVFTAR